MDNNENNVESSEDFDSDNNCGLYSTSPEYEPSPPRSRRRLDEDDPKYDPTADHQNNDQSPVHSPPRHRRTSTLHVEEVDASARQPSATTASSSNPKRKHGKRSRNQIPEKGILIIEELGAKGEPILPEGISARLRNICGAIVRDKLQSWITTSNWKNVPTTTKDVLWVTLKERFTFPKGQEKFARNFAEGLLGRCFWRSTLNKEYVQKGNNSRDDLGRIPPEMWEEFKQQKNMPKAKALSEENTVKAMKAAQNPHHLGAEGRNWVLAQISKVTPDGKVKFKHPTIDQIYERLEQLAEAQKKGLFKLDREKDQLTAATKTAEHSGRVQGMSQHCPGAKPTMLLTRIRFVAPSSASSNANVRYPVDDISGYTMQVATGIAITGHVFPKAPPPEYAWVQVVMVLDESCEIDIPTNEGIEVLNIILNNASPETSQTSKMYPF
uniref:Transposase Tnp1/En/Spm-like domain-containing protein n=1 Tax=Setaria viridis TaxID=4556 RepID=A0A4U6UYQ9_SETVI|nr:hypothetical protein SEVIR_4G147400v2 [Setaria viridis]